MTTAIQVFEFKGMSVRVMVADGREWFVAKDVCDRLELTASVGVNCRKINASHKGVYPIYTPGGVQQMLCVDEAGLYRLIVRSDKPEADAFLEWVTAEVLPTLRKQGTYTMPQLQTVQSVHDASISLIASALIIIQGQYTDLCQRVEGGFEKLNHMDKTIGKVEAQTRTEKQRTMAEFQAIHGLPLEAEKKKEVAFKLVAICKERGLKIGKTKGSAKYPRGVNMYNESLLAEVLQSYN